MATSTDWTLNGLDNPLLIQNTLLQRFENETGTAIVDTNNPACVLMEMFANLSSSQMKLMDDTVRPAIFPSRAVTMMDVLKHISDYDYVDIVSAPCTTTIILIVEKSYIMTHSVDVYDENDVLKNYKKLMIPRSTVISIGEHKFGLYYPIEFRSDVTSGRFSVLYDTTAENPLKSLETNVLDFEFREYNGHKLAYIKIPVYQFDIDSQDISMTNGVGFKRKIPYTNKFYAIRAWADVLTNWGHDDTVEDVFERKELDLRMAGQTYDPTDPTLIFTPDSENSELLLEIPYVYFSEGRIQGTLHLDIYTTEGKLDYTVPYNTDETCVIDMFSHISDDEISTYDIMTYAEPFRTMPALHALPQSSSISGGSDGLTFEEIRDRVINGVNTNVLQTPADITAYFAAYGYKSTLYRDGITDRIFIVSTVVKDTDGTVVGMDVIPTNFDLSDISEYSTIVHSDTGSTTYTILPSTVYKFDKDKGVCTPLTDTARRALDELSPEEKVEEYNSNIYTLNPFHLQIDAATKYPTTITYDMLQVKRLARTFISARDDQYGLALNTVNLDVYHRDGDIKDRYRLSFRVSRIGFTADTPVMETSASGQAEKKIRVLVGLKNSSDEFTWSEAKWTGTEAGDDANTANEVFSLTLTPNYIFHQDNNQHTVQMAFWDNDNFYDYLLKSECRVILLLKNNLQLTSTDDGSIITFDGKQELTTPFASGNMVLPTSKLVALNSSVGVADYYAMTEHKCIFQFGSPIDELNQHMQLTYSEAVYQTHKTTKYRTIDDDKYEKDDEGNLKISYSYKLTTDTTAVESKFYYSKSGDSYTQLALAVGATIPENTYERSITINRLYPAGTLTCMTVTGAASVVPNKYTASNYLGCTGIDENFDEYAITQAILDAAVTNGTTLSIKDAPTTPRFEIVTAEQDHLACVGSFELKDALTAKPISSMSNVWALVGNGGNSDDNRLNTTVISVNALYYVINHLAHEITTSTSSEDPISDLAESGTTFEKGTFLLIVGDTSLPTLDILGTLGEAPATSTYTRLYFKYRELTSDEVSGDIAESTAWICICQGKSKATINAYLEEEALESTESVKRNPKYYGFAYVMNTMTGSALNDGTTDAINKQHYISFLTTMSYTSTITVYTETSDSEAIATKQYYIVDGDEYVACEDSNFNDDGSFISGVTYYEKISTVGSYTIPDFGKMEKSAWEAHAVMVENTNLYVVADTKYFYKNKELYDQGITKWMEITGVVEGHPITEYIDVTETGDGKVYFQKTMANCTDGDYAWEQNANRWPWECTWYAVETIYKSDDVTVDYLHLATDDKFDIEEDYERSHRYWEYSSASVILDDEGKPLEDYEKDRSILYQINMIQMDAKLAQVTVKREDTRVGSNFGDDGNKSNSYPYTVVNVLREHFDVVGAARNTMFTNTRLFFEPVKSLGYADFNVGDNIIKSLPLDITMKFRLHVTKDAYEDDILLKQMKSTIIDIIDSNMDGRTVNCAEIASQIVDAMDGTVKWVDILGINDDPDLQTMNCIDEDCQPHLSHKLELLEDMTTIDVGRGLDIEAVINE